MYSIEKLKNTKKHIEEKYQSSFYHPGNRKPLFTYFVPDFIYILLWRRKINLIFTVDSKKKTHQPNGILLLTIKHI